MSTNETTPPQVDGFETPIRSYGGAPWLTGDTLLWGVGFAVVGVLGILGAIVIAILRLTENPTLVASLAGGFGALAVLIGGAYLIFSFLASQKVTWIFEEGIIRKGVFRTDAVLWSEVDQLTDLPRVGSIHIRKKGGPTVAFYADEISEELYLTIRDRACEQLVPVFVEELRSGKSLESGPIKANREGLRFKSPDGTDRRVDWDEVEEWFVDFDTGLAWLVADRGPESLGTLWMNVPNLTPIVLAGRRLAGGDGDDD